ncbi:MAG TPA: pyruvate, phosphate dikinase, partial [Clostridiales bacterium]|nr:pyruvate, phosphate dikinase [Clostridiales bacterium]
MPGMMDTILNLGINDSVAESLAAMSGNPRWAYDSYRRFIMMFSDVAMGYNRKKFDLVMDELKEKRGVQFDAGLTAEDMQELVERFKAIYKEEAGENFPQDPKVQLMAAVRAVFGSWMNDRAVSYRRMNDIPGSWGTAV